MVHKPFASELVEENLLSGSESTSALVHAASVLLVVIFSYFPPTESLLTHLPSRLKNYLVETRGATHNANYQVGPMSSENNSLPSRHVAE